MQHETSTIVLAVSALAFLILLIVKVKLHPFLALMVATIGLGLAAGVSPAGTIDSCLRGFGDVLGKTGPVVGLGTVLGGILIGSGGADRIAKAFIGESHARLIPWTVCAAALLIGMPHLFDVSFVMLAPLVYTVARRTGAHLLWIGLPLAAGLYTSHGLLPPHSAPMAAVATYHANTGLTLLFGLLIALPTAIISGPLFTRLSRSHFGPAPDPTLGPAGAAEAGPNQRNASLICSVLTVLIPPLLMLAGTLGMHSISKGMVGFLFQAMNDPVLSLLAAIAFAFYFLGVGAGFSLQDVRAMSTRGLPALGAILLILGAGGAFKEMLTTIHLDGVILHHASGWRVSPLILAWAVAGLLRICIGSATVATVAASGIVAPLLLANPGVTPELMVLATASGAVMMSHVNDSGFWLFKEYFQLSVSQTLRTWTVMLTVQSLCGLAGVLLLQWASRL